MTAMTVSADEVALYLKRRARWSPFEIAFWIFAFATIWLFPGKYLILKDTAILALFALSLDLILGYAGIISLGQAAFFGLAGYFAGLVAKHGIINEPVIALVCSGLVAAMLGFVTSFLVLRGSDLTRLMVTLGVSLMLGELANRYSNITGGADGLQGVEIEPVLGRFRFDLFGHNGYIYCLDPLTGEILWHNPMKGYGVGTPTSLISVRGESSQLIAQAAAKHAADSSASSSTAAAS